MAAIGRVLLMDKGAYSGSTIYNQLDWVRDNGASWVCKVDGTVGIAPPTLPTTSNANWTLMAADGSVSGSVAWSAITGKPFNDVDGTDLDVNASNEIYIKRDTFGTVRVKSGATVTDLDASGDSIVQIEAGNNVTISADDTATPKKLVINSTGGGGGASSLDDLTDVTITSPSSDQVLKYNGSGWVNDAAPAGGHTMINNATYLPTMVANSTDATDDKVASTYAISNWSNAEITTLIAHIDSGDDTVGVWNDAWETDGIRTGWVWHECLYHTIPDNEVEISIDFAIGGKEVVGLYAYRVDDEVAHNGVNGGAIAIKLTSPIQNASGVDVAINLKRQRTNLVTNPTILS